MSFGHFPEGEKEKLTCKVSFKNENYLHIYKITIGSFQVLKIKLLVNSWHKKIQVRNIIFFVTIGISVSGFSQKNISKLLKQHNTESIPYISIEELKNEEEDIILLDSREEKEYQTSHIKNAIHVGYDFFNIDSVKQKLPSKDSKIVAYCSIGIRSEYIAEKLKKAGYHNIRNLYGGIFEWKNNNLEVFNYKEKVTDSIHTFSKAWSTWLKKGIKVYD